MSLLELVTVLAVVGMLISLTLGALEGVRERSRRLQTEAELAGMRCALEAYRLQHGSYPVVEAGDPEQRSLRLLRSLGGQLLPDGTVLESGRPFMDPEAIARDGSSGAWLDVWGTSLFYGFSPEWGHGRYVLVSAGPDGTLDGPDSAGRYDRNAPVNRDNLEGDGASG